ncbi:Arc family DNA-binding protein [Paraburkholderia saeva]|uniref:Arc-like DNA binding domain-containing protein n=1 Tax=Paraburkholderia saeva TaxID=2777537 RepID=A0A9N8X400_9BURK|nr:Arc family DNA-binding protein [Paraburkholderia saeva]CAG4919204.1 hypothetical protein LMG31841_04854 [Paraburkholderia saeva]
MARDEPQVNLRIPADLKDRIDKAAEKNKRSMTAEVVARLEESFGGQKAEKAPPIDEYTLDLFAEKVGQVLDTREKKKKPRSA